MTPQERQLIDDLFDRLSKLEGTPRDPNATAAIAQGLRIAPNAVYALVQTVLVQDEALKRANSRIQELEAGGAPEQNQSGGFLDSMRDAIFGQNQSHGSVPNVPPPGAANRPVWNSGQVLPQAQSPGHYDQGPYNNQSQYGQPYGSPQGPAGGPIGGGGGSFLGTAAAAAAGVVGGSLLLNSIRSMMGGSHQSFGDTAVLGDRATSQNPWSDQSGSNLARDAGINDVASSQDRNDDSSRTGLFDSASNDQDDDDRDDMDLDSDNFGNDGDNDYA
ncbi:DUF2076 domain-containing protein [Bradyrhizobium canariense]|uniref:ABC transporter substrate-binding protein n=1 Tax=Bradyrhizobium canariense TaxID=255045 RepID=A0A1H1W7G8_9BRAD|nr:DUF2076 domain-containing protein [Bradyrhizobium canariense]SDS92912.1 hypothetical protein SAMN05444158_3717 [Bradyrhizobium canariense]